MEIWYNLLGVYSKRDENIERATKQCTDIIEAGYVEDADVFQIAKETNSVLIVEVEQEDGYYEFIVVNNKGELKHREIFSFDNVYKEREEILKQGIPHYFTKKDLKMIDEHSKEHGISREKFIEEYLGEFFLELYEQAKTKYTEKMMKYYK